MKTPFLAAHINICLWFCLGCWQWRGPEHIRGDSKALGWRSRLWGHLCDPSGAGTGHEEEQVGPAGQCRFCCPTRALEEIPPWEMNTGKSVVSHLSLVAIALNWKSRSRSRIILLTLKILPAQWLVTAVKEKMAHSFCNFSFFFFSHRYSA